MKKKITDDMINQVIYKLTIISYIKQGEKLYCDDESNIFIDNSYIPSSIICVQLNRKH